MNDLDNAEHKTLDLEEKERLVRGIAALGLASLFSEALSATLVYPPESPEFDINEEICTEAE